MTECLPPTSRALVAGRTLALDGGNDGVPGPPLLPDSGGALATAVRQKDITCPLGEGTTPSLFVADMVICTGNPEGSKSKTNIKQQQLLELTQKFVQVTVLSHKSPSHLYTLTTTTWKPMLKTQWNYGYFKEIIYQV